MSLEKIICTQCGSNQIKVVSATVFECESCGTILKEEQPSPAPVKEKPFRSKREFRALGEADDSEYYAEERTDGSVGESDTGATKMIFYILIVTIIGGWIAYMLLT